jgi:hypothetical protein
MVSRQEVQPDSALVRDLGAESIDFLDLVFRLEEALHTRIGVDRWDRYVRDHLPGAPLSTAITTRFVCGFARAQLSPGERHPAAW